MTILKIITHPPVKLAEPFVGVPDAVRCERGQAKLDELKLKFGHLMPSNEKDIQSNDIADPRDVC